MKILGIETSCDDTAIAVLEVKGQKLKVKSNIVSSQVKLHAKYGGVFPALAAREHAKNIDKVLGLALKEAKLTSPANADFIAVTAGPGLAPSLLVGITFAKTLAWRYKKPLVGVNHLEGHIHSNWLPPITESQKPKVKNQNYSLKLKNKEIFPALNLIVSGGHTELVLMQDYGSSFASPSPRATELHSKTSDGLKKYKKVGETLDDAVGEAFDKVARLLGLGYPGGPIISKLAESGNPEKYPLPSPMLKSKDFNFSYSGLKTAVLYLLRDLNLKKMPKQVQADIAASFQKAATDVLVFKTMKAVEKYKPKSLLLSGGVSANSSLRNRLEEEAAKIKDVKFYRPHMSYTTDNAAMIALAGYFQYKKIRRMADIENSWRNVNLRANWEFG